MMITTQGRQEDVSGLREPGPYTLITRQMQGRWLNTASVLQEEAKNLPNDPMA